MLQTTHIEIGLGFSEQWRQLEFAGLNQIMIVAAIAAGIFFVVLLVGFAYEWRTGALDWVRATEAAPAAVTTGEATTDEGPEIEVFYTFTWVGRARGGGRPQGERKGKPGGKPRGKPKGKPRRDQGPKTFSAKPEKKDKIDPNNPFAAALMGLKDQK